MSASPSVAHAVHCEQRTVSDQNAYPMVSRIVGSTR